MSTIPTGFNANEVDPSVGFDPLPAGQYVACITESEQKPTKAGTGHYLQLAFTVLEGPEKGRVVWARLNLWNENATAVKIARAELSAICRAVGVLTPKDSIELHNLPITITIGLEPRQDKPGEKSNVIKKYESRAAAKPGPSSPIGVTAAPWTR